MKVWLIETGYYEDHCIWGVAASVAAAVASVRRAFGPPYIVAWEEKDHPDGMDLVGRFDEVPGYSTAHEDVFWVRSTEVLQ